MQTPTPDSYTDDRGIEYGKCCICAEETNTHDDANSPLGRCGDCGRITCLTHREESGASRCTECQQRQQLQHISTLSKRELRLTLRLAYNNLGSVRQEYQAEMQATIAALEAALAKLEAARPARVEAHGHKGLNARPWRKSFTDTEAMMAWAEKNDATILGTRDAEGSR